MRYYEGLIILYYMQFNSLVFLFFIAIVFIIYWLLNNKHATVLPRNIFIIIASYIFYAYADGRFTLILFAVTLIAYVSGKALLTRRTNKKAIVILNIVITIGTLFVIKYYNFFAKSFCQAIGVSDDSVTLKLILPLGLSFYSFMALGYVLDCYKGKIEKSPDALTFFSYLSFFPHLLMGPIDRGRDMVPQFEKKVVFDYNLALNGMRQILWGLFAKVVVADSIGGFVDPVWSNPHEFNSVTLLITACLYSIQIYADFSGYSNMAIGIGKLLGIRMMKNFDFPYFSRNIAEFWHKWHISLTRWFTEYLYIPLGGNRKGRTRTIVNTIIVFSLCGFWHGANWTYLLWGLANGCFFIPLLIQKSPKKYKNVPIELSCKTFAQMLLTFILFSFSLIFFRAESIASFCDYMTCIGSNYNESVASFWKLSLLMGFYVVFEWFHRNKEFGLSIENEKIFKTKPVRWGFYYALLFSAIYYSLSVDVEFIYSQF